MSATDLPSRRVGGVVLGVGLALMVFCVLLTFYDPALPAADLDASWALASEYALKHGLVFGRDFVFTFGPYSELATRFFDPRTFPLVLFYDTVSVVSVFWIALCNRSLGACLALTFCFLVLRLPTDALSPLALFGVFLICVRRHPAWPVFILLAGPLLLSKLSFGIVLAPLLLLADAERILSRRAPLLTLAMIGSALLAFLAAGQPLAAFPDFIRGSLEIILGYGRAMQIPGSRPELVATLAAAAVMAVFVGVLALDRWRRGEGRDLRPPAVFGGFLWLLFALFKMAFVRQDIHTLIFHMASPAGLAMAFSYLDEPRWRSRISALSYGLVVALALASSFYWRSVSISRWSHDPDVRPVPIQGADIAQDARRVFLRLPPRLATGFKWASGGGFGAMSEHRRVTEALLARRFPSSVVGTVDVVPWDLAPIIASGLDYAPRPVPQSYSSYTPALQKLDAAHFAGPRAPETLILKIQDGDGRLPSLALGPSLIVIGARYDAVDRDGLGLVLRRRSAPRSVGVERSPTRMAALGQWIATPGAGDRLVMARIKVRRTLAGTLVGLVFREPVMSISLRTASGRETTYRLVPDMAQLGAAVSPLPKEWDFSAPTLLDPGWSGEGEPVVAVRLNAPGSEWAFKDAGVSFDLVNFAPGFAARLKAP